MRKISVAFIFLLVATKGFCQQENEKIANIKKLLEVTESAKMGMLMLQQLTSTYKTSFPQADSAFWSQFQQEVSAESLTEMIVPIYDKYYTNEDIKELIRFYDSPTGKKVIKTMPLVIQESMSVGQEWGKAIGEKVYQKLLSAGYVKDM